MANIQLLIIDPQNDFIDQPGATLGVPGALEDMKRLSHMIERVLPRIDAIRVSLDSHQKMHIGNVDWWIDRNGNHPAPFTKITVDMVDGSDPEYKCRQADSARIKFRTLSVQYAKDLYARGRNPLMAWPAHCLQGSHGAAVHPILYKSLELYQDRFRTVEFKTKGTNIYTEHFSVISADVPNPDDPSTLPDMEFVGRLATADIIGIGGIALSHCVRWTVKDIADKFGPDQVKKLVLLTDATSPVPGFEADSQSFIRDMRDMGMQLSTTADFLK